MRFGWMFAILAVGCGGGGAEKKACVGAEGCACTDGGGCDSGLVCEDGTCAPAGTCGDGVVDDGEGCDLGAKNADDGVCRTDCAEQRCGDGSVGPGEGCDDGNAADDDACTVGCAPATCGDGVVQPDEACDDANGDDTDGCLATCALASCGDGAVRAGLEACDDGNAEEGDACPSTCEDARCGDGFVETGVEACDDANADLGDACLPGCIAAACGDGYVQVGVEDCDDANDVDGDDCAACVLARCGDGIVRDAVEVCDDGNDVDGDGCNVDCIESGTVLWTRTVAPEVSFAQSVAIDPDGNVVVSGTAPGYDPWLAKYDASGANLWSKTWDPPNGGAMGFLNDVTTDADGNIYTAGHESQLDVSFYSDVFVRKYDPDGNVIWTRQYAGAYGASDTVLGVAIDSEANVVVSGYETASAAQLTNIWVRKYDNDGGVTWTKTYNGPSSGYDSGGRVAIDADDEIFVVGQEYAGVGGGRDNVWLRKYDVDGNEIWTRTYDGPAGLSDWGADVAVAADGSIVIVGTQDIAAGTTEGDIFVRKYDADGNVLWTRSHDGPGGVLDRGIAIDVDLHGNVVAGGQEDTDGAVCCTYDIWVRKYDPDGAVLWTQVHDGPLGLDDFLNGVACDATGEIVVAGSEYHTRWISRFAP